MNMLNSSRFLLVRNSQPKSWQGPRPVENEYLNIHSPLTGLVQGRAGGAALLAAVTTNKHTQANITAKK